MRIAYFDCFSGASGDMILGSMIDAGLSPRLLRVVLNKLNLPSVQIKIRKVLKNGVAGTQVLVEGKGEKRHHRNLKEMLRVIGQSDLEPEIKEKSREIFKRIASVEAKIHREPGRGDPFS
jgi:uncharacterized protein (DUF111 family)